LFVCVCVSVTVCVFFVLGKGAARRVAGWVEERGCRATDSRPHSIKHFSIYRGVLVLEFLTRYVRFLRARCVELSTVVLNRG